MSRISKVAIVKHGAAMLPKAFVEMALGLSNAFIAAFFYIQEGKQFERSKVLNKQEYFTSKRTSEPSDLHANSHSYRGTRGKKGGLVAPLPPQAFSLRYNILKIFYP